MQPKLKANVAMAQAKAEAVADKADTAGVQADPRTMLEAKNVAPLQAAEIAATVMPS